MSDDRKSRRSPSGKGRHPDGETAPNGKPALSRRRFVERSLAGAAAAELAGLSLEARCLLAAQDEGAGANVSRSSAAALPAGRIGKLRISRLICGGNLFSGFAHSRELIYVSRLMKEYFTPEKIMDTLQRCEENGINAAILRCDEHIIGVLNRYRKERGGKIQWIAQTYPKVDNLTENIRLACDHGAVGAFMQGGIGDQLVADGRMDLIGKIIEFVKQNGMVAGVGSHSLDVPRAVEKEALDPDFYFKTFNNVGYNSQSPQEIADLMKTVQKPWIAFKVLGAGMLKPREGFELALRMGADFLNVGMFDFQVTEDATVMKNRIHAVEDPMNQVTTNWRAGIQGGWGVKNREPRNARSRHSPLTTHRSPLTTHGERNTLCTTPDAGRSVGF
jgi:hypothetical protein